MSNDRLIMDNFARINVYMSKPEVEIQEQKPSYGLSNLFSDIGKYWHKAFIVLFSFIIVGCNAVKLVT